MGHVLLNIPDEVLIPFRKMNKGQMSQLITDYIRQYMQISLTSNQKIEQRKEMLADKKKEFASVAAEIQREEQAIKGFEEQKRLAVDEESKLSLEIKEMVNDEIHFAKAQGRFVDLVFEAKKAGFDDVGDFLYKRHEEARK